MTDTTASEPEIPRLAKMFRYRRIHMLQAVVMGLAGVVALAYPVVGIDRETSLLGWLMVANGAALFVSLIFSWGLPNFWVRLMSVFTSALLGFFVLIQLVEAAGLVIGMLVVFLGLEGLSQLILARRAPSIFVQNLLYVSAAITLVIAVTLNFVVDPTVTTMSLCLGFCLLFESFAMIRLLRDG